MPVNKDELLAMHELLHLLKDHVQDERTTFPRYDALGIHPHDTHRPAHEHEQAILLLAEALATTLKDETFEATAHGGLLDRARSL